MDKELMKKVLSAVIQHIDYDLWKSNFNEETVEYGQDVDTNFDELFDVVEEVYETEQK